MIGSNEETGNITDQSGDESALMATTSPNKNADGHLVIKGIYGSPRAEDRIVIGIEITSQNEIVFASLADYCCCSWDFFKITGQLWVFYLQFYTQNLIILIGL